MKRVTSAKALTASVQLIAHSSASLVATSSPMPTSNPTDANGAPEHTVDIFTWSLNVGL